MVKKTLQQSLIAILLTCWLVNSAEAQTLDQRAAELSQLIAKNMETGQKRRIAVLELTGLQGQVTNFGRYLSEELITRFYDLNKVKVVERQLLNKVIAEQKLSLTGVVDPDSARKLGSVLGVDGVLFCPNLSFAQASLAEHIDELNRQIAMKVTAKNKTTIAVVEFADLEGNVTNFGRFLSEELITRLHETEKFKVIERQLLNQVIKEQKLTLSGIVDPASAKQLGKVLGVDAIVSGSISDLGKTVRVNARLISTETGEIFAVAAREFVKDQTVIELMGLREQQGSSTSSARDSSSRKSTKQSVKASLYTFDLDECRLSGTTIVCDLTITNNDSDRMFSYDPLVGGAGLVDDLGGTYRATSIRVANRNGFDEAVIVAKVPTKSRIIFDNVSPQAMKIASLRMQFNRFDLGIINHFRVEFRDVALSK